MSTKYFTALIALIFIPEYMIRMVSGSVLTSDGRNDLVKLLGHLDRSDELTAKLPTISAFMELNNDRRATTTSESNRRRGGHPACECPEESDTFSVSCYDRRLSLISTNVLKGQEIERNMTQLRNRHISLKTSASSIEDRINRMSATLFRGNGPHPGLIDTTNAQMDVLRRVSDALTTCISSIWVQEFEVTAMNEEEFERLNKVVGNATEAVLNWFTGMQALEESMTFQNLNLIVAYATAGLNVSVSNINDAIRKTYNALKALDAEFGSSFTGVDKLQKELEAAGDELQDKVEASIRSAVAAISDVKSELESEAQTRITSELIKKGNQLIQSMQSVASKKISQAGVASHEDIRDQSNATLQDLLPRATQESLSIVKSVTNVAHHYDKAVHELKEKLDAKLELVLKNNTEWAQNATGGSRRSLVDTLNRFAETKVSDIQAWISNRDQTELNIRNKIESLNSKVQTELTSAINAIGNQKMGRSLSDASNEMDSRLNELDSDIHAKTSELYRVYHGGLDQSASIGHAASSGAVDTTGNLQQISTSASGMLSSASDRVMADQSALLKSFLGSVNDNIGLPLAKAAPVYPSRINAALRESQSSANDQVSLYTSKAAAAGTLAAVKSDNTVKSFLQNVSSVGDSALDKQRTITSLIGQQTAYLSQSAAPLTTESAIRRDMASAAVRLAESEDGASMYLGKIAQNIPSQISMHPVGMQSAFTQGIDSVDHVRGNLNDATDQHRLGMVSSMSALSESSQRVNDLGRQFDDVSANQLGAQDAALPRGLGEVYRLGQAQAMDISRVAQTQLRRIDSVMRNFGRGLDSDAIDTMKNFRSQVDHEVAYAKMIKKFLGAASPDLAKAAAELVTHRGKMDGFVNQTWKDIKESVRLSKGNTSDIWRVLLDEFVDRSKRHNKTSVEELNVIESQALNFIDQIVLGTNQTIEKVFDAFAHGEDVTKFHLSDIAQAATNVSYESNQNLTQTELSATNTISSVYDGLHKLLNDRSAALQARIGNDSRPAIPYRVSLDQLAGRRNAREMSQKLISKQRDVVQTALEKEIAAVNRTFTELAMNRTRASAKERLETVAMGGQMGSTKEFISDLLGDSVSVVSDYRNVVDRQKRANQMTAETLFDQVAAVRSTASAALGRMTEHLSANREQVITRHSADPKIMAGIIRSQVVGMSKVLDVFSRGAGSEGLLKSALQTTEDAGATFLHQSAARNADMEQQLSQNAHSGEAMIAEIQDDTLNFMDSLNEIDQQASSLGTGLDSWSRSIGESVGNLTLAINNLNITAPNVSAMLNASIKSLVSSIESSLGRSMNSSNWLKLNNSLDAYLSKLNLTVAVNTTTV